MTYSPGTYFTKDRYSKRFILILDGQKVGEVPTKKEATKWWQAHQSQ